jgi:hypothetical protein
MVELMKESGCMGVFLGIESGSDRILKNMNKVASVERYLNGISLLKENEIVTYGSFIIGFPGETDETVRETLDFIKETEIEFYRAQVWYFDPITPICKQRDKYDLKGSNFEWKHKTMDSKTASDWVDRIFLSIDKSIWIPYHHFDFDNLWHLLHHGLSMGEIKELLKSFNGCLKEKLLNPSLEEVSYESISRMKAACLPDNYLDVEAEVVDRSEAEFEF